MSYLNNLRMVFAGDFQADTSTVNNDVRHYDNETFQPRFQKFQKGPVLNGWWNPIGSGAFRLINCKVQSVYYQDGSSTSDKNDDGAIGLLIGGSDDRVGGKIVDLDPQWQLASQIWGLEIRLTDGQIPDLFAGHFEPTAFRDILFGRQEGASAGDQTAAAAFQSVLTNLQWADNLLNSRFLQELKAATSNGLMSVRLNTFGYKTDHTSDRFTIGTVVGTIGPYYPNEPRSFVLGRRMVPLNGERTSDNINFFDCHVDQETHSVFADFGNALPLTNGSGRLKDLGDLQLAVLTNDATKENQRVTKNSDFIPLGTTIPYRNQDWLRQTGGIWVSSFSPNLLSQVTQQPLALIKMFDDSNGMVAIRESVDGWLIRAENFVHRVEPGRPFTTELFAAQYGSPFANTEVEIELQPVVEGSGGGSETDPCPPQAPIPDINTPPEAVSYPSTLTTDSTGKANLAIQTQNPGNPRGYLDGQIYMFTYQLANQAPAQQQQFDFIFLLLYGEYTVPEQPTWVDHIQPIFQQYSNLYPIMSQKLFDLGDYDAVVRNRAILELAFSLPPSDPNSMPVTRDLSEPKRQTILKWLRQKNPDGTYALVYSITVVPRRSKTPMTVEVALPRQIEENGGKKRFYESFKAAQQKTRNQ